MIKEEWLKEVKEVLEGIEECGHSEITKGCDFCDRAIDAVMKGFSIMQEQKKDEIVVENVIPAVCMTCHNTKEIESSLWRMFLRVCELDENLEVERYEDGESYENWTQTCSKWILSRKRDEEARGKNATIMYHSCHGRN